MAGVQQGMSSVLQGVDLPEELKKDLEDFMEKMQIREGSELMNRLSQKCFTDCVDTFRSKELTDAEERCVGSCVQKFVKSFMRLNLRMAELSQAMEQQMQQQLQALQGAPPTQPEPSQ